MAVTDLLIGKGNMYMGLWSGTTFPVSMVAVGNCPSFEIEPTEEKLPHYSSQVPNRTKDAEVVIETGYTLSFILDEWTRENIAKYIRGIIVEPQVGVDAYIKGGEALSQEWAVRFISDNTYGPNFQWDCWRVSLGPGGAAGLISEEFGQMSYTAEGLLVPTVETEGTDPDTKYYKVTELETAL